MLQIIDMYIGIFVLCIGEIFFVKTILEQKPKVSFLKLVLLLLLFTILYTFFSCCLEKSPKTALMFILHVFEFRCLFEVSYLKSIFVNFLYFIVLLVPECLYIFITTNLIGISKNYFYESIAGNIISNIIICILFITTTIVLKKPLRKIMKTEISTNIKIILLSLLTLLSTAMFFYTIISEYEFGNNVVVYLVAIIVLIAILFTLIKQTIENNKLMKKYDQLLEFMKTYENEIEKERTLRHETKNEFLAIKAKIHDKQKNQDIINYIDEILNEKIEIKQEMYAKFGYLPANGIKGLCYFKVQEAENKGIHISLNISKRVEQSSIYQLNVKEQKEFGKILGVLLDNAIEASVMSEEKKLGIEAYMNKDKEFKMIISNTYQNEVNKEKLGIERFSTKGKERGHGLLLVKHIIKNNQLFNVETTIQEKIYSQTITIKWNQNEKSH